MLIRAVVKREIWSWSDIVAEVKDFETDKKEEVLICVRNQSSVRGYYEGRERLQCG
jgi:hypothetical protein